MSDLTPTGVITAIIAGTLIFMFFDFTTKYLRLKHIPGPRPFPFIGNLYMKDCVSKFQKYVIQLRSKYGGVFVFWAAHTPFLVVTEAKIMRQVLTEHTTFNKGWVYSKKFAVGFGEGLVTMQSGDHHKANRSLIQRYFLKGHLESKLPLITHETLESFRELLTPGANLKMFDILYLFELVTVHVFFGMECGISGHKWRIHPQRKNLIDMVSYGSHVIGNLIFLNLPTSKWINPQVRNLKSNLKIAHSVYDEVIAARKRRMEELGDKDEEDVLSIMIQKKLPKEKFYEHLTTLICAGFETTAHFGAYTSYLLARYPEIQKKCKDEIREVLKGESDITPEKLGQLKYLTCVLKESLRMYSIIPSIMRRTTKDVEVTKDDGSKLRIPAQTNVMLPFAAISRVDKYWEDPNEFKPERFLNIAGESSAKHGYFPFAYGVRNCIGSTFAIIEAKVAFALLLQRVTLSLNPDFKPKPTSGISLVSLNGMKLTVSYEEGYGPENI